MSNLKRYTLYIINAIDILSCFIAYFLSFNLRFAAPGNPSVDYRHFLLAVLVAYFIYSFIILYRDGDFINRNTLQELISSLKMSLVVMLLVIFYLNVTKMNAQFSRIFEALYFGLLFLVDLIIRIFVKSVIVSNRINTGEEKVLLVSSSKEIRNTIKKVGVSGDWRYKIDGIVSVGDNRKTVKDIQGIRVINEKEMFSSELLSEFDSVIIVPGDQNDKTIIKWLNKYNELGKKVNIKTPEYNQRSYRTSIDRMFDLPVITYTTTSQMNGRQSLLKRIIDIVLSLLLLPLYLILYVIVKICNSIESPGPTIIKRTRVGKNNKRFYQYRFRVYRIDAQDRLNNNLSPYTKIGKFLNDTHLDGFPMIANVLLGDMSFVGPKAPNLPLYLNMNSKERSLLIEKPGIIGPWTAEPDKKKAVLDTAEYIENWNVGKDISIALYCLLRYISFKSLRIHGDTHEDEELKFVANYLEENKPFEYNKSLYNKKANPLYLFVKRTIDIVLSGAGTIFLLPIFAILGLLIILDDGGSPFYSHSRIGQYGKKINIYKFRSMRTDAGKLEDLLTPEQLKQYKKEFKIDNDPRITKIGNFIRKTSIDELPQILNILKGDMSIIGPRPLVEQEIKQSYKPKEITKFLSVKPGLTGYWQAYARNNATYESGERQKMEMYYVDNQSLWLDIKIFFKTIISVIKKEGAK